MKLRERISFRLIHTPCCGHLLCWVNSRLPNHCPECGQPLILALREHKEAIRLCDYNATLMYDNGEPARDEDHIIAQRMKLKTCVVCHLVSFKNGVTMESEFGSITTCSTDCCQRWIREQRKERQNVRQSLTREFAELLNVEIPE